MASEVGEFLRAKRARLDPADCGLPSYGQRRVPGLRREEVALAAGVSPDYYVRLEQGRARSASDEVLDAVARVLRLDDAEREHLHRIARPPRRQRSAGARPRAGVLVLLEALTDVPAFVLGPRMDVLAANLLGEVVLALPAATERRNVAAHVFLDQGARTYYLEWEQVARETVAHLRRLSGLRPADARLRELIGALTVESVDFVRLWSRQEVMVKSHGTKRIRHPDAGVITVDYETLTLPAEPEQMLVTYTAADQTTRDALVALGSWHSPALSSEPKGSRRD